MRNAEDLFVNHISPEGFDPKGLKLLVQNLAGEKATSAQVLIVAEECIAALAQRPNLCRLHITKRNRLAEKTLTYFVRQELAAINLENSASLIVRDPQWWYPYYFSLSSGKIALLNPTDN